MAKIFLTKRVHGPKDTLIKFLKGCIEQESEFWEVSYSPDKDKTNSMFFNLSTEKRLYPPMAYITDTEPNQIFVYRTDRKNPLVKRLKKFLKEYPEDVVIWFE